ncbi:E3 ubiquitin-protein ligase RNF213-like [Lacerta agilis]|uniref:E3 ubiquitin-protein ligase RNF213-like n=1 Tax=Lacerta agilis TaxID=80427 RepID=UPI00141926B6|nr:E3 ubiquitin-protein ligase RNF213-like [Lacerta agilis]
MEPGGELRVESSPALGSSVDKQPLTGEAQGEPEKSLSESPGSQASHTQKKKKKKKKKKKRSPSDAEVQDSSMTSLTSCISSAPPSLDYLSPEVTDSKNQPKESQSPEDKLTKSDKESAGDSGGQIKSSPLDIDQNLAVVAEKDVGDNDSKSQDSNNGAADQHIGAAVAEEKMEEESSEKNDVIGEQTGSSKGQSKTSSTATGLSQGNISDTQTSVATQPNSDENAENVSLDPRCSGESSENKFAKSSTEDQNREIKTTSSESEVSPGRKKKVEETKQQTSASVSKKVKLDEQTKSENVCEKPEEATTPAEGSEKGKTSAAVNQKKQQKDQKTKKQQTNQEVKQSHVSSDEGVTVYFHAILSKDFKLDPGKHKIFIRAQGISGYLNFSDNVCEMTCTK